MADTVVPRCAHKGKRRVCGKPAMPNTRECAYHWLKSRGWDAKKGEYLPFAEDVNDKDYPRDAAYANQA
jgi:hypothetical protein